MNLGSLQDAIVGDLRPHMQRIAARNPQFVARVIKRLVERVPDRYPAKFFEHQRDTEDFTALIAIEVAGEDEPAQINPIWLTIFLQVLLPALIRVFLLWWAESELHRNQLRAMRDQLAQKGPVTKAPSTAPRWRDIILVAITLIGCALLIAALAGAAPVSVIGAATDDSQHETAICKALVPRLNKDRGGKWEAEYRLWDSTRVDLLNEDYAVEVDFAHKWAECLGQALYYGHLTDRQPVCLLLAAGTTDDKFVYRCQTVCEAHSILLWVVQIDGNGDLKR